MNYSVLTLVVLLTLAVEKAEAWGSSPSDNRVRDLIGRLKDTNTVVRAQSADSLAELGPLAGDAIPDLIAAMGDEDEDVRSRVGVALAKIGSAAVPPLTKELITNKDPVVRSLAAHCLGMMDPVAGAGVPPLVKALADSDPGVRRQAVGALARIRDGDSLPALIALIKRETDAEVLRSVLLSIGVFGPKADKAIPILIRTMKKPPLSKDSEWYGGLGAGNDLGSIAAQSLAKVGSASAMPLLDVFTDPKCEKKTRLLAGWGLNQMGPDASPAVAGLIRVLEGSDDDMREMAITVLGCIGPKASDAIPALVHASDDPCSWIRARSAAALFKVCPRNAMAVRVLARSLKDPNARIRFFAATELGLIGPAAKDGVAGLTAMLRDEDAANRVAAARALGRIGASAKSAIPFLLQALRDVDRAVRNAAAESIERIRAEEEKRQHTG